MNILIDSRVLAPDQTDFPFRKGTLFALRTLQISGIGLWGKIDDIKAVQRHLLEQEQIAIEPSTGETDYYLTIEDGRLLLNRGDKTIIRSPGWDPIVHYLRTPPRTASVQRKTNETNITVQLDVDGTGLATIHTGIGFLDHMIEQIARHSSIDLTLNCDGDLEIDEHHTIEDTALALGEALYQAIGDKRGIERYGFVVPMDESEAKAVLDLSGRPYLVFKASFSRDKVGDFPTEMTEHFFYSLAMSMKATLHIEVEGKNDHHKIEACFKAFAKALGQCIRRTGKDSIPSSKGTL